MAIEKVFTAQNIRACEEYVFSIQSELDNAVANDDRKGISQYFDLLVRKSEAAKILAINRITRINKGKKTAGVDGIKLPQERAEGNLFRHRLLKEIDITRNPSAIKRVLIPKGKGKFRPLGIPTIHDRITQEILRIGIEPIAEYHFHNNSYGFRPRRSCQDAMAHLFIKLSRPKSPRYVLEGDIKGCFDNIKHDHIISTLLDWKVPEWATKLITSILESDILEEERVIESHKGTPQGGVISPLLANVALTTLDNYCLKFAKYGNNPIVRYADDFVIVCESGRKAKEIKEDITEHLQSVIGLELSEEKTKITHITKGFNFLGFNFRKMKPIGMKNLMGVKEVLLIRPQSEKVADFLYEIKRLLKKMLTASQVEVIDMLNPKIIGFGMYYRHCSSKATYTEIDYQIWQRLTIWGKRKYNQKDKRIIISKLFHKDSNQKYRFMDKQFYKKIYLMRDIVIFRHIKINQKYRVYDKNPETIDYWTKREYSKAKNQLLGKRRKQLFLKQKGNCALCNSPIVQEEILNRKVDIHHIKPKRYGGSDELCNLQLVHSECHREIPNR